MGEYISLSLDLDKATVALLKAQQLYELVRRDELALTGTTGSTDIGSFGGPAKRERPEAGAERSSPAPGEPKEDPKTHWEKINERFNKVERFVKRAVASPVEFGADVIGMIPEVGPIAKNGWEAAKMFSDLGAPALKGVLKTLLPQALEEFGIPPAVAEKALATMLGGVSKVQSFANRMRNWDEAFAPTLQTLKDVFRLRSLAGGTVTADKLGKMYDFLFDYNKAETSMRRKMEQFGQERLWEGISKSVERSLAH